MLGFAAGMNDLLDQRRDQARNPGDRCRPVACAPTTPRS